MSPTLPKTLLNTISSHTGPINALTFSSLGGTYVLTGSSDRSIHLSRTEPTDTSKRDPAKSGPIQKYTAHGYAVLDLACSSNNQTFASVGGDRNVFLWDVQQATTLRRFGNNTNQGHASRVNCVKFTGESDHVLVSGGQDRSVRLWDLKSKNANPIQILDDAKDSVSSVAIPRNGYEIVAASVDQRIRSYDLRMGKCFVDTMPAAVTSVEVTRDGRVLLVSCLDGRLRMLDRNDGTLLQSFVENGYKNEELRIKSCFGMGEATVLSGSEADGRVRSWDILTGESCGDVEASEGGKVVSVVAWRDNNKSGASGDGVWASGGVDGMVKVWGKG